MLTDRSSEYCGNPERHEYELYLAIEDIDYSRTKTKSLQTTDVIDKCYLFRFALFFFAHEWPRGNSLYRRTSLAAPVRAWTQASVLALPVERKRARTRACALQPKPLQTNIPRACPRPCLVIWPW
jgi:hypothetical protein